MLRLLAVIRRIRIVVAPSVAPPSSFVALFGVGVRVVVRRRARAEEVAVLAPELVLLLLRKSSSGGSGSCSGFFFLPPPLHGPGEQRGHGPRGELRDLSGREVLELVVGDLDLARDLEAEGLLTWLCV